MPVIIHAQPFKVFIGYVPVVTWLAGCPRSLQAVWSLLEWYFLETGCLADAVHTVPKH